MTVSRFKTRSIYSTLAVIVVFCGSVGVTTANEVTQWNLVGANAALAAGKAALQQSLILTKMHLAVHDALNSIDERYETYSRKLDVDAGRKASAEAAIAAAARDVLSYELSSQQASIDAQYFASLSAIPDGRAKTKGIAIGQTCARAILALRASDGSNDVVAYIPGAGPGVWQPTLPGFLPAAFPGWGKVTPFALKHLSQFRPAGPPALDSAAYAADYNEVKSIGVAGSTVRTAEQSEIARFHFESSPAAWNRICRGLAAGRALDLWSSARMFALLNMAMNDGYISNFEAKYIDNFWRPVTAIRAGDTDGNADTTADPGWTPFLVTPAHPDYTSGHSVVSGAASTVLARFLGTDAIAFSATSGSLPGVTRSFTSFSAAASEIGDSRVYAGIHFRSACRDGLSQGQKVGRYVMKHYLKGSEDHRDDD